MKKELTVQELQSKIINLPGRPPVMLDKDLAQIYETKTRSVNQAANRNPNRFPDDFRFQLTEIELKRLKSQFVIASDTNNLPFAYTCEGCNMMSACLHTPIAIDRSVFIMRAFSAMERDYLRRQADSESASQISGDRFDLSVKRFKTALEAVRLIGITDNSRARRIANKITKNTTGVDLMGFILPFCSEEDVPGESGIIHQHGNGKEADNLIRFVSAWWDKYGDNAVDSAHLLWIASDAELPNLDKGNDKSRKIRLGKMLSNLNGNQVGDYIITDAGKHRNIRLWKLKPAEKSVIDS